VSGTLLNYPRKGYRMAASRQVVYEQDRRAILAFVALQAAIIATSTVASGLGGANVLAITSRLM
jgi:hypothetical protein